MLDTFTLTAGALPPGALRVLAFTGREAASRCYRFRIDVAVSEGLAPDLEGELLGERAVLDLGTGADARGIAGIIRRVEVRDTLAHNLRGVRVELVPRLFRLSLRVTSRIFQDKTVPEIVTAVLAQAGIPHRSALAAKYARRSYCVQHQESDLAFVERLLAEEGVWYWFDGGAPEKRDAGEMVVLSDSADLYPPIAGDAKLAYREQEAGALLFEEHHVFGLHAARALAPGAVLCRDYDFRRPGLDLRAEAPAAPKGAVKAATPGGSVAPPAAVAPAPQEAELRVYDHHGEDETPALDTRTASVRLDRLRQGAARARARSACPRLAPGLRFELVDHDVDALNGGYVIVSLEHEGRAGNAGTTTDSGEPTYANRVALARATVPLRPEARPNKGRRIQQVTEMAIVVGPAGQEIHTDELGRVKVQFQWDLDGKRNDQSSCWLRVATPWAGPGYGFQMVPRIGMEVLVTFLGGDTDRPVVAGCLPNAANRPPFTLPAEKTKSGLLTRTSPRGTGGSELSFDDAAGRELVRLHAERDLDVSAERDREQHVGRDERITVRGRATERVCGDKVVDVAGTLRQKAGARSSRADGNVSEAVGGRMNQDVGGSYVLSVGADAIVHVAGSSDLVVGTPGSKGVAHHAVEVHGAASLSADTVRVSVRTCLTLTCGDSRIELTPEGVKIRGKRVEVAGVEAAELRAETAEKGKGARVVLGATAEVRAGKVRLLAPKGELVLDKDARLSGEMVYINSPDQPDAPNACGHPAETQPFKTKLSDAEYGVWANKRYELHVDERTFQGTTDAAGLVDTKIPRDATSATLVVWFGEYPTGDTRSRTIQLRELPPTSNPKGAAERLAHLGYFHGEAPDTIDAALAAALKEFQAHAGLPGTGKLDASTVKKLDAAHGK